MKISNDLKYFLENEIYQHRLLIDQGNFNFILHKSRLPDKFKDEISSIVSEKYNIDKILIENYIISLTSPYEMTEQYIFIMDVKLRTWKDWFIRGTNT